MSSAPTYRDVVVYANGQKYVIANDNHLLLTYSRTGGWGLWRYWDLQPRPIAGEYSGKDFCVAVRGVAVCGKIPDTEGQPAQIQGWDGTHMTGADPGFPGSDVTRVFRVETNEDGGVIMNEVDVEPPTPQEFSLETQIQIAKVKQTIRENKVELPDGLVEDDLIGGQS